PGARSTPPAPENVSTTLVGHDAVAVKWEPAPRARHYRVWKKVSGVDEEFVPVGSPADRDFTLENLPSESVVEIAVTAVNRGGESRKSAVITVQLLKCLSWEPSDDLRAVHCEAFHDPSGDELEV
ncbi:MAG: fibronectin type III domain-containing protein, partial [Limisphaerales bacterium]